MKVAQSCLTLCDPMDYTVHGILQARILEWVSLCLLQGMFPNQGLNPGLLHCSQILHQLSHKGSPIYISFSPQVSFSNPHSGLYMPGWLKLCSWFLPNIVAFPYVSLAMLIILISGHLSCHPVLPPKPLFCL